MNNHVTPREEQVIELMSCGHSTKEIAEILQCSYNTVDTHIKNIKQKTGLQKAGEIVCAYFHHRYRLPVMNISERARARIAAALLALSLFGIYFETTDFLRVMRSQTRTQTRTGTRARRSGRKGKEDFYLNVA